MSTVDCKPPKLFQTPFSRASHSDPSNFSNSFFCLPTSLSQHVQHHVQPIKHEEHGAEQVVANQHPETKVSEKHSSTDADAKLLDSVTSGHKDEVNHAGLDRKVVDKGEFTKEIEQ